MANKHVQLSLCVCRSGMDEGVTQAPWFGWMLYYFIMMSNVGMARTLLTTIRSISAGFRLPVVIAKATHGWSN